MTEAAIKAVVDGMGWDLDAMEAADMLALAAKAWGAGQMAIATERDELARIVGAYSPLKELTQAKAAGDEARKECAKLRARLADLGTDAALSGAHGGPAFPNECAITVHGRAGMTLRDYFATHCDIGDMDAIGSAAGELLLGAKCPAVPIDNMRWWADCRAALRYMEADAMLKARGAP